jgi:hypothetical protein
VRIDTPAPPGAAQPFLAEARDGVHLSWLAPSGDGVAFVFAIRTGDAWSVPRPIAAGGEVLANWADVPSIQPLAGGGFAAHWPVHRAGSEHACDVRAARCADDGAWTEPRSPHRDGTAVEHAFASLVGAADGGFTCIWLDGREYDGKEEGAPGAQTQLRAAEWMPAGDFGPESVLDPRVCDCCPTAAIRTARGVLVAYRDRGDDEQRDIGLVRWEAGRWSAPYALANDGWRIPGCPVNGPALAAAGDTVAAVWFTQAGDTPAVRLAFSHDAGATFSPAVRIDDGQPAGRVDVALLPGGDALAVWVETDDHGNGAIRARRVQRDNALDPSFVVATTTAERAGGFPRVTTSAGAAWFAWVEPGEPSHVRMATLELPLAWRRGS